MTITDRVRLSLSATLAIVLCAHAREAIKRMQDVEARAHRMLMARVAMPETARRVAAFTFGDWAQCYPAQGYDLGEDCALFVLDWLTARHVDTTDAMHSALEEWRARDLLTSCLDWRERDAKEIRDAFNVAAVPVPVAARRAKNRHERRRALSRRWT